MELAILGFFESLPAALAVGLLLLPRLINEDASRFKPAIALLAGLRAVIGFVLVVALARSIIPAEKPLDAATVSGFVFGTVVGKAWMATQALALLFAGLAIARLFVLSDLADRVALWTGIAVIAVVAVTGHAMDDSLPLWTQISFVIHTAAGLTWFGGLLGLVWWMYSAQGKPPEVAHRLAERWSLVAKIAMGLVALSGLALAWENVGSFPNLLATPYGRYLTLKLAFLCAVLLLALSLARYITRQPKEEFDTRWYGRIGAYEAGCGMALLMLATWIGAINPASHETDLYWPLPFRISYIATWGQKVEAFTPIWWWGVAGLVLALAALVIWFAPPARSWRMKAAPAAAAASVVAALVSLSTEAYTDTYNDPTQDYTSESVARGYAHFQEHCVSCHGPMGEANGPLAKDLKNAQGVAIVPADLTAPHVGTHTIGDIFHWLTFGGQSGVMPNFKEQLDVDDRWDVINYLLVLSYTQRSRFLGPSGIIQWLIAPDFQLIDPKEEVTTLFKLRGTPTLISFARCRLQGEEAKELASSLQIAAQTARTAGAHHVTIYDGDCPQDAKGREASHPRSVETAYSVVNRLPNVPYTTEIAEAHFLVDRSGYVRARFQHFTPDNGGTAQLRARVAALAKEPIVVINLHSH
jgi:putative copper resistance protein D